MNKSVTTGLIDVLLDMKNFQKSVALIGTLGAFSFAGIANAQPKPQNSDTQLLPIQVRILQATGLKIVAPTYVPAGFRLRDVQAKAERSRVGGLNYVISYERYDSKTGRDQCFAIEATSGGIGGLPEGDKSFAVNNAVLGKTTLYLGKYGVAQSQTLLADWLGGERGPFYRFVGANVDSNLNRCGNISPQEAVKVTESLRYLKP